MKVRTLIIGAGAAGMFCAAHAGGGVLVVDHARRAGEKIRISGGGRCNFTNLDVTAENFLSENPHFAKSALARYNQWDFIECISAANIAWHEKTLGQLFCDGKSTQVIAMLLRMMEAAGAELWLETAVTAIKKDDAGYRVTLSRDGRAQDVFARNLVIACGGKSIPKMGATGFAYQVAADFNIPVTATRPALVPFTFSDGRFASISGISLPVLARAQHGPAFSEALLCTHRGLSGPAMLQVSSFWQEGEPVTIILCPEAGLANNLITQKMKSGRRNLTTELASFFPGRFVDFLATELDLQGNLADWSDVRLRELENSLKNWRVRPTGTEGYRTAEVTLGGVSTDALSSQTMEAKSHSGLFFIGECVDVTGWLGGYNFQWAWSSAYAAGTAIAAAD